MKQTLQLRLGQQLTMTPQLQQAIRLLQLSTLELQSEVQEALDSNMMLEVAEDGADDYADANFDAALPRDGAEEAAVPVGEERDGAVDPVDIPGDLPVDSNWEDVFDTPYQYHGGADDERADIENQRSAGQTLHDSLYWQLSLAHFSDSDKLIAGEIIDAIDDDGYLKAVVEDIQSSIARQGIEADLDEIEAVLRQVQNFEPAGVGARDLRECLLLQLRQSDEEKNDVERAQKLVGEHLDLLAARDYNQLMKRLQVDKEELQATIALIRSLDPRPGAQIGAAPPQYVIPDVIVRKKGGGWSVELNAEAMPRLRINPYYARLVRRADNSADNTTMRAHLQEARWFLKSLRSRADTLLRVSSCIVERQQSFLEYGDEAMRPMVLNDIARAVNMHESTISRVTTQKYMHTPRGIYELKYFFSSHVSTESGGEASSTAIRALLKKLIAAENAAEPLSDSKLAMVLADNGINVARRTVAKYREAMGIPSSSERRRLI